MQSQTHAPASAPIGAVRLPIIATLAADAVANLPFAAAGLVAAAGARYRGLAGSAEIIEALDVPHENQPYAQLTGTKLNYAAVFTDFFARVTRSRPWRNESEQITSRIVALVWASDYLIDDFGMPKDLRVEVLESLAHTVRDGSPFEYDFCAQLTALSGIAADLHQRLGEAPRGSVVIDGLDALAQTAIRQIEEPPTMHLAEDLGARSIEVLARVPFAFNPHAPDRILPASRAFGSILQLIDDLWDRERDEKHGIATFATIEHDYHNLKRAVCGRIDQLREEMIGPLRASEAAQFRTHLALSTVFYALKEQYKQLRRAMTSRPVLEF